MILTLDDGTRITGLPRSRTPDSSQTVTVTTRSGRTFASTWGAVLAHTHGEAAAALGRALSDNG